MRVIESNSYEDTFELGKSLAENARPGMVFALNPDLGCGKTVLTKGFAEGLGVKDHVSSPTFTIVMEYTDGRIPFYHFDVYRIGDIEEMYEIGYEDYFSEGVCFVEWAELIEPLLPDDAIKITIEKDPEKGFDYRKITIED